MAPEHFEALAASVSNCPTAQLGGNLGQLVRGDSVQEFEAAIFETPHIGLPVLCGIELDVRAGPLTR